MNSTIHGETFSWTKARTPLVRVHFEYIDSHAESVCLAGTFNGWHPNATPLARCRSTGVWTKDLELPPGTYEYNFMVDGRWKWDRSCREAVENPFGGLNSVLHVRRSRADNGAI